MKKAWFALAFFCEISLGMNPRDAYRSIADQFGEYSSLYAQWRDQFSGYGNFEKRGTPESGALERKRDAAKPRKFDPAIIKTVIIDDIGSDDVALQALQLFSDCKLHEFIDFYLEASMKMSPINVERFKEILLPLASILNIQSTWTEEIKFTSPEKYQEYIGKIVSIWGCDRSAVTFKAIQHSQFCFEIFLMLVLKLELSESGILLQAVGCMADEFITPRYDWDGKAGEMALYGFSIGCHGDNGGRCDLNDVWPNWLK